MEMGAPRIPEQQLGNSVSYIPAGTDNGDLVDKELPKFNKYRSLKIFRMPAIRSRKRTIIFVGA